MKLFYIPVGFIGIFMPKQTYLILMNIQVTYEAITVNMNVKITWISTW